MWIRAGTQCTLVAALLVTVGCAAVPASPPRNPKCACADASLCESLPKETGVQGSEVVAFYSGEVYGANGSEWRVFDWNKTNTVAMYGGAEPYNYGQLQCVAHKHKAKIIEWNFPSSAFNHFGFGRRDPAFLLNATAIGLYADYVADYVYTAGIDGICLDIESPAPCVDANAPCKAMRAGNTMLTCKLSKAMKAKVPGAVLTWAMPLRVHDNDAYDYKAIMDCGADYLTPMAYEQWEGSKGSPSLEGPAYASPTVTSAQIQQGVADYKKLGVPPQSLVMAMFWGGTEFMCNNTAGFWGVPGRAGCRLSDRMQVSKTKLAQKLDQLHPFYSCTSSYSYRNTWANLHILGQPNTVLAAERWARGRERAVGTAAGAVARSGQVEVPAARGFHRLEAGQDNTDEVLSRAGWRNGAE
jgi:hypothetical protein